MDRLPQLWKAAAPALFFFALAWAFRTGQHEPTAVMNAVVAERGGFFANELLHPLYTPLLTAASRLLEAAGATRPHWTAFQALDALAGAGAVAVAALLLRQAGVVGAAAIAAALGMGLCRGYWHWALQPKGYGQAMFFLIAALAVAVSRRGDAARRARLAGILIGLSAGFTLECAAALPAVLWALKPGSRSNCLSAFVVTVSAGFIPLILLRLDALRQFFSNPAAMADHYLHGVSPMMTLWDSSLRLQARSWAQASEKSGWIFLAAVAALGLIGRPASFGAARRAAGACAAAAASLALFMLACHPHSGFSFAVPALLALAMAALLPSRRPVVIGLAFAAGLAGLASLAMESSAQTRISDNFASEEGAFLKARLGPRDLLVCAGPPDWRLLYFLDASFHLARVDDGRRYWDPFLIPVLEPGAPLESRIERAEAEGGRAVLAADALFLPTDIIGEEQAKVLQARLQVVISRKFLLNAPWISPRGQRYYPIRVGRRPRRSRFLDSPGPN